MIQRKLILWIAATAYVGVANGAPALGSESQRGEYGFALDFLRQHYSPPRLPGESNHFVDLWSEPSLSDFARECRITNSHALFINSHGGGLATMQGKRYSYYPHPRLLRGGEKPPCFSAADMAAVLGAENAGQIHNILISGCNADGAFSSGELRACFPSATNIVHMPAGKLGYQPMFRQILTSPSSSIQPLYQTCAKNSAGKKEFFMGKRPSRNSIPLTPYIAELFKPQGITPYKLQVAGREILAPDHPSLLGP